MTLILWLAVALILLAPVRVLGACCSCAYTVAVTGCGSHPLQGATVVASQSGVTIQTVTTDAFGDAVFTLSAGTFDFDVTASRLGTFSDLGVVVVCNGTRNVSMSTPAAGYACIPHTPGGAGVRCGYPLKTTLVATSLRFGTFNLTWTGSVWSFSGTVSAPACGPCTAQAGVPFNATLTLNDATGGSSYSENYKTFSSAAPACPNGAFANLAFVSGSSDTATCYVPGVSAFSYGPTITGNYACGDTIAITE